MKYILSENVSLENVDGSIVLIDLEGNATVLNETASFMVEALLTHGNNALGYLAENYDVSAETLTADFEDTMDTLCDYGMMKKD